MAETPKENVILPEKYYLDYFLDLIAFVKKHSSHLLDPEDDLFLAEFFQLSENAQCLYIRFANRKGLFFRTDKLHYNEIKIDEALEELEKTAFIKSVEDPTPELLPLFTKQELLIAYAALNLSKTLKKEDLYQVLLAHDDFDPLLEQKNLIQIEKKEAIEYLKMLFFGHYHAQMTEFVIRDVGHVKLEDLSNHEFKPWFGSLEEAKSTFDISQINSETKKLLKLYPASILHDTIQNLDFDTISNYPASLKVLDKLAHRLAYQLEREKESELALFYYEKAVTHPARERRVRILDQLKRTQEAEQLAQKILANPINASESIFATDFLNRPKIKILRSTSRKIKETGKTIEVVPNPSQTVESIAIEYFETQGYQGIHGENYLWNNLFGLTFWEELMDSQYDSFHHPLQRTTSDLNKADFFDRRKGQLNQRLSNLKSRKKWMSHIEKLINDKTGISSSFVYWHPQIAEHMSIMLSYLPLSGTKELLLEMAKNLKANRRGFPDLLIWKDASYHFYEVKSPNDQLSAQQLFWIDFMQSKKIKVDVLKLSYLPSDQ